MRTFDVADLAAVTTGVGVARGGLRAICEISDYVAEKTHMGFDDLNKSQELCVKIIVDLHPELSKEAMMERFDEIDEKTKGAQHGEAASLERKLAESLWREMGETRDIPSFSEYVLMKKVDEKRNKP